MKNILSFLLVGAALAISPLTSRAQTAAGNPTTTAASGTSSPSTPTTPADVISSIGDYFTDLNTNLTWANTPFSIWTGANYQSGVNTSAELGFSYDVFKPTVGSNATTSLAVAPEVIIRNAGVAGTFVESLAGGGLSIEHYSLKFTGYIDGGYNENLNRGEIEFGGRLLKKITVSTHGGIGLAMKHIFGVSGSQNTPSVTAFLGWDF